MLLAACREEGADTAALRPTLEVTSAAWPDDIDALKRRIENAILDADYAEAFRLIWTVLDAQAHTDTERGNVSLFAAYGFFARGRYDLAAEMVKRARATGNFEDGNFVAACMWLSDALLAATAHRG